MNVSSHKKTADWMLLVFSLPAKSASRRVEVWRKLKRYGVVSLKSSGYVLPRSAVNEERFQWLAAEIRKHKGEASVLQVAAIDNLPAAELTRMFNEARNREYEAIGKELQKLARKKPVASGAVARLRRRFDEVRQRDFFAAPGGRRAEQYLSALESGGHPAGERSARKRHEYAGKTWVTRPRPGIDRSASAWLIRRFIDSAAAFVFAADPSAFPGAIPFDMFTAKGFSHVGGLCTFEVLVQQFGLSDARVTALAHAVHDADLADEKFGRTEALAIDQILTGWANQGISDDELLRRGMEMIEGLYNAL
jgi:hypothetical protein